MAPNRGRRSGLPGALLMALALLASPRGAAGQAVAVIAHPAFPAAGLSLDDVRALARGQLTQLDGRRVTVLLPPRGSAARRTVLERVYRMSEGDFQQFWISRVMRDGAQVPKEVTSVQAAQLVARVPGIIALVAADEVPPGARVLAVIGG